MAVFDSLAMDDGAITSSKFKFFGHYNNLNEIRKKSLLLHLMYDHNCVGNDRLKLSGLISKSQCRGESKDCC